ncbi:MAG: hypothetical protein A2Z20_07145 [Bdellovibrionales bacterium RBG_16_40_8]|nr:MAG: hypothetical protein A2Z20_07145 [Bdellovibrionales bacterium RBG_16_40_8]
MSGLNKNNIRIAKTIKLFIGGDFPRTESGRTLPIYVHNSKILYAHICRASRKDFRNAVVAAQNALNTWSNKSAHNRGQILYRMAEMTEGKRQEFVETLTLTLGYTKVAANKVVDDTIDAFIYYAGWADKYQQIIGGVNPVSGPHHNFTSPDPVGVVGLIADETFDLSSLVAQIAAIISSGNTLIVLMNENGGALLSSLAEVFATSDLTKGVVNLLTGNILELYKHFGNHMELQSICCQNLDEKIIGELRELAADNMKRVVFSPKASLALQHVLDFVEYKTVWHPIGN